MSLFEAEFGMLNLSSKLFFFPSQCVLNECFPKSQSGSQAFRENILHPEPPDEFPSTSYICIGSDIVYRTEGFMILSENISRA